MFSLALLAMSLVAVGPEPQGNQADWVLASDIPLSQWSHATLTSYDLTLDASGHLIRCEITHASGSKAIDDVVCASLMRRARYKPARDEAGAAVPSVVRDHVRWNPDSFGDNEALPKAPDIVIELEKSAMKKKAELVQVIEIIDASGQIESCTAEEGKSDEALAEAACRVVGRPDISTVVRNEAGTPVRGVRAFNVSFIADSEMSITIR